MKTGKGSGSHAIKPTEEAGRRIKNDLIEGDRLIPLGQVHQLIWLPNKGSKDRSTAYRWARRVNNPLDVVGPPFHTTERAVMRIFRIPT